MPARRVTPPQSAASHRGSFGGGQDGEVNLPTSHDADMNSAYMNYETLEEFTPTNPGGVARVRQKPR